MDSLPYETLCDIFLRCMLSSTREQESALDASFYVPLHVSHVCRSWRSVSLEFQELWSYLRINFSTDYVDEGQAEMIVEIFDTWLSRTNGSPICFELECELDEDNDDEDYHRVEHMITTLLSQQHRWKDVDFKWHGVEYSPEFPGLKMSDMPLLTSLTLHIGLPSSARVSVNIDQSPLLKRIDLDGDFDLSAVGGSYSLEEVRLAFWSGYGWERARQTCLQFLQNSPFLVKLEVEFSMEVLTRYTHQPRIVHHSLRDLILGYGYASAEIINNVTLPSLEALRYSSDLRDAALLHFVERSKPPLTFLSLYGTCGSENEIIGILKLVPTLREFRYERGLVNRRFFDELAVRFLEGEDEASLFGRVICPNLETLYLRHLLPTVPTEGCVEAWIDMLKSRAKIQKTFERIYIGLGITQCRDRLSAIDVCEIEKHTELLDFCFEDKGFVQFIIGDRNNVLCNPFPPSETETPGQLSAKLDKARNRYGRAVLAEVRNGSVVSTSRLFD